MKPPTKHPFSGTHQPSAPAALKDVTKREFIPISKELTAKSTEPQQNYQHQSQYTYFKLSSSIISKLNNTNKINNSINNQFYGRQYFGSCQMKVMGELAVSSKEQLPAETNLNWCIRRAHCSKGRRKVWTELGQEQALELDHIEEQLLLTKHPIQQRLASCRWCRNEPIKHCTSNIKGRREPFQLNCMVDGIEGCCSVK